MKNRTGYVYDPRCLCHSLGFGHPEAPERLTAIETEMEKQGLPEQVEHLKIETGDDKGRSAVKLVHSAEHIESVEGSATAGETALLAVRGVLQAVDGIFSGTIDNAFCAVRPPGHHSHNNGADYDGRAQGEGFCFYNNAAIAARYAQRDHGAGRILIVDWDYHHGNGTEWAFYSDPSVFFFSTHILYGYPGTGHPDKRGDGPGKGYNLNVPLSNGAEDRDIIGAWQNGLLPALKDTGFTPDFIIISAGFDSREGDLLGTFNITDSGYRELTRIAMNIAKEHCGGKLLSVLEGGYNQEGLAKAAAAHVETLLGGK